MQLRIGWLYGHEMNIYGDRGNIMALVQRARWRDVDAEVQTIGVGEPLDAASFDLFFWGGGQDRDQESVVQDMQSSKGRDLAAALEDGAPMLGVCGGYQFLGHYYRPYEGDDLPGIGFLDVWTVAGSERFIGNVVVETDDLGELVGFENHSGLTYLGDGVQPLGRVRVGRGNNGQDSTEGARYKNVIGCYLHGALLPKNPQLTDWLISTALERRYDRGELDDIDSGLEQQAHDGVLERAVKLGR